MSFVTTNLNFWLFKDIKGHPVKMREKRNDDCNEVSMNCSCFIANLESEQFLHIFQVLSQIWNYMKVVLNGLFKGCKKYDWPTCAQQKTRAVCFSLEHEYNERMDTQ